MPSVYLLSARNTKSSLGIDYPHHRISKENQYEIYPFVHSFSNIVKAEDQLQPIHIPDILPGNLPLTVDFSMTAGDFLEVYGDNEDNWGEQNDVD